MNDISEHISGEFVCPPSQACDPAVNVYRFITETDDFANNFKSLFIVKKEKANFKSVEYRKMKSDNEECQLCGLSVYTKIEDCENLKKVIKKFKESPVARGEINGLGKIMNTPSNNCDGHHTWWYMETHHKISEYFTIVDLESGG